MSEHHFSLSTKWTGNNGEGTSHYRVYERSHTIIVSNKPDILASSDPAFRGDPTKHNPEDLLIAALSGCHMLSYLHVCVQNGIVVTAYEDHATGTMVVNADGRGHFTEVILYPVVTITDAAMIDKANDLHHKANELCFIANSCNFPILHKAVCKI
ncbi:MAG TPA: OsmC family protein [Flavobacterium sp.]|nr:OsmC family protein [Flavobacterium sp.]